MLLNHRIFSSLKQSVCKSVAVSGRLRRPFPAATLLSTTRSTQVPRTSFANFHWAHRTQSSWSITLFLTHSLAGSRKWPLLSTATLTLTRLGTGSLVAILVADPLSFNAFLSIVAHSFNPPLPSLSLPHSLLFHMISTITQLFPALSALSRHAFISCFYLILASVVPQPLFASKSWLLANGSWICPCGNDIPAE